MDDIPTLGAGPSGPGPRTEAEAQPMPPLVHEGRLVLPAECFSDMLVGPANGEQTTILLVMLLGQMGLSSTFTTGEARALAARLVGCAEALEQAAAVKAEALLRGIRDDKG